uniref:Ig-like domain-containing protein n=1 Tax=Sphenodon punctatus TaxID=8508 RepID=A0A8D0G445_SPHPU
MFSQTELGQIEPELGFQTEHPNCILFMHPYPPVTLLTQCPTPSLFQSRPQSFTPTLPAVPSLSSSPWVACTPILPPTHLGAAQQQWGVLGREGGIQLGSPQVSLAGSAHSLGYYGLAVSQPGEGLLEFLEVGYLDDQILSRYDSETPRYRPMVQWMEQNMDQHYWNSHTKELQQWQAWSKENLEMLRQYYNQTDNWIHALQSLLQCEVRVDGSTGGFLQLSYDGRDFLYYDLKTQTWVASVPQAVIIQRTLNANKPYLRWLKVYLQELCIHRLKTYLVYGRESLQPKEPQVLVSDRPTPEGFTRLSCRAHGFYPQDIAVVWLKNGVAMSGETQSWGIVPSGDGTYQTRVTLEIDPSSDARYQCRVEHESLAQELRVAWEPKSNPLLIVGAAIGALLLLLLVAAVTGIVLLIRKRGTGYSQTASK